MEAFCYRTQLTPTQLLWYLTTYYTMFIPALRFSAVVMLWLHLFVLTAVMHAMDDVLVSSSSPYVIIIDGGSTGSRLHIFEFVGSEIVRHGSARAQVPLSAFGPTTANLVVDPSTVADHLMPAFRFAAKQIPQIYHSTTPVTYQATAGMRLLDEWQQQAVYDALHQGLTEHPDFVFRSLKRSDLRTLSGELEGYYGAVAANYLQGTCSANLTLIDDSEHPVGALDMGGSSTQIVFLPKPPKQDESYQCSETDDEKTQTCEFDWEVNNDEVNSTKNALNDSGKFFSTSYLSYGVDQFRERLWTTLVDDHRKELQRQQDKNSCDSKLIENPCAFLNYELDWLGYKLIGTGNATGCMRSVQRLIPHPTLPATLDDTGNHSKHIVGGVVHPPVSGQRFVAMSLYFFTLDSLRELSGLKSLNESWPNPSIQELVNALPALCQRSWTDDLFHIQHNSHKYTRAEVLPHRCLEAVYMVTLLRDGFGFDPDSRNITFLFETEDGNEVEWTLGMALSIRADSFKQRVTEIPKQVFDGNHRAAPNSELQNDTDGSHDNTAESSAEEADDILQNVQRALSNINDNINGQFQLLMTTNY